MAVYLVVNMINDAAYGIMAVLALIMIVALIIAFTD
jgi:hypothetical protein